MHLPIKPNMKRSLLSTALLFSFLSLWAQVPKDLNLDYMLRGYIFGGTAVEDAKALGGFGGSSNVPKKLNGTFSFTEQGFFLKIDTLKRSVFAEKFNGYTLYIVNRSDSTVKLDASDSRLYVLAEAFVDNKWQPIEYFPSSWCGNSYHRVYIKSGQYWDFSIPKYTGSIHTRIRYRLTIATGKYLYSNEISARINRKQLTEKQGHNPTGIMDPYGE
jgi:hypothetical protein